MSIEDDLPTFTEPGESLLVEKKSKRVKLKPKGKTPKVPEVSKDISIITEELTNYQLGPTEVRATARLMYEVQGFSIQRIADTFKTSVSSIKSWATRDFWLEKGKDVDTLLTLTRTRFLEKMSERGMPPEMVMDLMMEGMTKPMTPPTLTQDPLTGDIKMTPPAPDYRTRHKYQHDYLQIAGLVGSGGSINVNAGGQINVVVNLPKKNEE